MEEKINTTESYKEELLEQSKEEDKELLNKETTSDFDVEKNQIEEVKKMAKQN